MNDWELNARVAALLAEEGHALDTRDWDRWLSLYDEDVLFWMPSWRNEFEQTSDPAKEMALFYFESRAPLEDRVWRLRTGKSIASVPLSRTAHAVSNVLARPAGDGLVEAQASWTCHAFHPKRRKQDVFFGRYELRIRTDGDRWRIAQKKISLLNDYIPTLLDFYCV